MGSLRRRDAALLWSVLGIWALCFAVHVSQLRGGGLVWLPFEVDAAQGADQYPVFRRYWSQAESGALRAGDVILAVGARSMAGASRSGVVSATYAALDAARFGGAPLLRVRRDGAEHEVAPPIQAVPWPWRGTLLSLCFALTGAAVFVRSRGMRAARLVFLASTGYAIHWAYFFGGSSLQTGAAIVAFGAGLAMAMSCTVRALFVFPEDTAREGALSLVAPVLFVGAGLAVSSWAFGTPMPPSWGLPLNLLFTIALATVGAALLALNYRATTSTGRRRIKWVIFGFYAGLAPIAIASCVVLARPTLWWVFELASFAVVLIPISIGIAVSFHHLFDINGLITRAASVTILSGLLLAVVLFVVPRLAGGVTPWVDPTVAQAGLSVLVAGLLFFARSSLEPRLADWMFVERRRFETGIRTLMEEITASEKPAELLTLLGDRLTELIDPVCAAIYARADEMFAPVFAEGPAIAPALPVAGPLIQTLGLLGEPVSGQRLRRAKSPLVDPEREALNAMGADLLIPVIPEGGSLEALICLGEKRSGDVFTATDRSQLARIADRAAERFNRFDRDHVARAERELVAKLQSFVPGAVREQLGRGAAIEPGPREVTVLFADLVAYTQFSETRTPDEIFAAISRYTAAASEVVRRNGGAVVDFRGDGLMAVFGAPTELANKEAASVQAAREIVEVVHSLPVEAIGATVRPLRVGVGIATGEAYVGTIHSIDREIWTVLGNTTNLAARLEGMTRDFDAAVLIDRETAVRAGAAARDFDQIGATPVRGRSIPIELFALLRAADRPA